MVMLRLRIGACGFKGFRVAGFSPIATMMAEPCIGRCGVCHVTRGGIGASVP